MTFSAAALRLAAVNDRGNALRAWAFALAQFAIAAGALAWGVGFGWTEAAYRVFYLFGAVLNVVWLGLGTIWLLAERRTASVATGAVIGLSGFAAFIVLTALLASGAPAALAGSFPHASDVMPIEARVVSRVFSTVGSVVVLGGLLVSLRRRRHTLGLSLLATGVLVVAVVSSLARTGRVSYFSVGLAIGVALMYLGFIRAT